MDLELMDWPNRYTFPEEEKYAELDYAEKAYSIFVNALRTGATTRAVIFATRHCPATELLMGLMEELRQIQMTYGIPVQSHLSESPGEIDFVRFLRPDNAFYGDAYNDYDLFGKNDDIDTDVKTVMAHCVWSAP